MLRLLALVGVVTSVGSGCPQEGDSRSVALGERNVERGLSVPNAGDGTNEPATAAGRTGRRATAADPYMYVDVDDAWLPPGDHDLWVTVEFHPEAIAVMGLQYDAAGQEGVLARRYVPCEDAALGYRVGEWMHYTFHLPHARLGNGQNHHSDFRLTPPQGVVIGAITVSTTKPADYEETRAPEAEALAPYRVRIGEGFELTFGNDANPATAALYRMLGVTSIESYAHWQSVEPEARGSWDWSKWDAQAQVLRDAGLKWVPFLIAGCAYATPDWFRESEASHVYRCLEHGQDSYVQSLWNPALLPAVDAYLRAFAEQYEPELIESVLLGVTGIYGESIYPAGPEGGWTADRTGTYHNHMGFWCADDLAKAHFRRYLKTR
ncbi:MAG: glycosyl hydrolase family protein, partial [Armatimonadetes bacterium]|nr:glycosyl hydrolase family protein [Armatimonadota bacterium]